MCRILDSIASIERKKEGRNNGGGGKKMKREENKGEWMGKEDRKGIRVETGTKKEKKKKRHRGIDKLRRLGPAWAT